MSVRPSPTTSGSRRPTTRRYARRPVEFGPAKEIFEAPQHPYTVGLLQSLPDLAVPGERLVTIPGIVPSATRFPSGCRFRTRCPLATDACAAEVPALVPVEEGAEHTVACHHVDQVRASV